MEIQSDLIILPSTSFLPLPWSVRGPLGLATGSEVSLALVQSDSAGRRMPDIIVTPLQSEYLHQTFTLEVELGERAGAVADFLSWFGERIARDSGNNINIVLSETITLEGRQKHKIHIVVEPALNPTLDLALLTKIVDAIAREHPNDILSRKLQPTYSAEHPKYVLQQKIRVDSGWLKYDGWMQRIVERYADIIHEYDVDKVVVSSSPDQRLLRYIIPRKGVIEIRVPHRNKPGALKAISNIIREANYNILSSRLSRTPPSPYVTASTSVFVAACEPLEDGVPVQDLKNRLSLQIDTSFMIDKVSTSVGRHAADSLFLTPKRTERVELDAVIAAQRDKVRTEAAQDYYSRYGTQPNRFVFLSRRFLDKAKNASTFEEQRKTVAKIRDALESARCAVIDAADPGQDANRYIDDNVYTAVFSRLWASDACLVLALSDDGTGSVSLSLAHEIGFFAGRNKPIKVLVSASRERDPVFGNTVGKNRIVYCDPPTAYIDDEENSIYRLVHVWGAAICGAPSVSG